MAQHCRTTTAAASFLAILFLLLVDGHGAAAAPAVPLRVGVVLDLETVLAKKSLMSIRMALEDLYAANPNFTTRVELLVRDSRRDVVAAATEVLYVIDNKKVSVVIGPQSTLQAEFLAHLASKTKVPVITFSATGNAVGKHHAPYYLRACVDDSLQASSIAAFINAYGWQNVVLVYEDNIYGVGILPSLTNALQDVNAHVVYCAAIPASAPNDRIDAELYKLMTMQTHVFVVHMLLGCAYRLFARASAAGMMAEGYVWIVTDSVGVVLDSHPDIIETMQGVVGFRPYIPKSRRKSDFMDKFRAKYQQDPHILVKEPTVFQYWAYDVAWAVALAAEVQVIRSLNLSSMTVENVGKNIREELPASPAGPELLSSILNTEFDGLAGRFKLVDRQLQVPIYEIVNVIGRTTRGIGFWSPGAGLSRLPNSSTSATSKSSAEVLKPVVWPGDSLTAPRGWDFPVNGKKLRIGVPLRRDFKDFVNVDIDPITKRSMVTGYCIDFFEAAVKRLPYALLYEYIPYDCANSYDQLVSQVYFKKLDAAVGDVTITANRTKYVDFTMPYTGSGVSMLVLAKSDNRSTMWFFIRPFTKGLWFVIMGFVVFTGLVVLMIERQHPTNEIFKRSSLLGQCSTVFYFAFSTLTFSHEHIFISFQSRIVVVFWCFVVLVLYPSYTANLSSMLTAQRLKPSVTDLNQLRRNGDNVGYQNGSFVHSMLKRLRFDERKIKVYTKQEEYAEALRLGSKKGGVSAIFDEIPYITSFLSHYGNDFQMAGPTYSTDGFGFVLPIGSPLVSDLSKAILNLTEGDEGLQIEEKWFGDTTVPLGCDSPDTDSSILDVRSFSLLFIITGCVSLLMLLIRLGKRTCGRDNANADSQRVNGSGENVRDEEPSPPQNGMVDNSVPSQSLQIETNNG